MRTRFKPSFKKDLKKIRDSKILESIEIVIDVVKAADTIKTVPNLIKMKGYEGFYRLRMGDYRIGIKLVNDEVIFVRVLHRREIYRYFP